MIGDSLSRSALTVTYLYLCLAILLEAGWALGMKASQGLTRPGPAVLTGVLYVLSLVFLSLATRKLDVGTTYAIWAGVGMVLIAVGASLLFGERLTLAKGASIALIVAGVVGLNLSGAAHGVDAPAPAQGDSRP